jgi:hypothetical protein
MIKKIRKKESTMDHASFESYMAMPFPNDADEYLARIHTLKSLITNKRQWVAFATWWNNTRAERDEFNLPPATIQSLLMELKAIRAPYMGIEESVAEMSGRSKRVLSIITEAGGKRKPRRPYDEEDMQDLRDAVYDVVRKWGRDELAQIDAKRMALHALELSILDIEDEGETSADIDNFQYDMLEMAEHLASMARQSIAAVARAKRGSNPDDAA